jgi:periplasmic divalent cation tolerance protein
MIEAHSLIIIYTTLPDDTSARAIGHALVKERLAACVNIVPGLISIYRWDGQIRDASEVVLFAKTHKALEDAVSQLIRSQHPYEVPALFTIEPHRVASSYANWVIQETLGSDPQADTANAGDLGQK